MAMATKVSDAAKRIPIHIGDKIAQYGAVALASGIVGWIAHAATARLFCMWAF